MMKFRPSPSLTLLLLLLALIFGRLGFWQYGRMEQKQVLFDEFSNAPELSVNSALEADQPFARVRATGRYDPERHVLLDNKIYLGRAGVHVLTPFILEDGSVLLANRGWLPMPADRRSLPEIPTDGRNRSLSGHLRKPVTDGVRIGEPDSFAGGQWPRLVTYLDLDEVEKALGTKISPKMLLLDAADPSGFEDREWKAAEMTAAVHGAYAVQWFGLALAAIVIWLVLGVKRGAARAMTSENEKAP